MLGNISLRMEAKLKKPFSTVFEITIIVEKLRVGSFLFVNSFSKRFRKIIKISKNQRGPVPHVSLIADVKFQNDGFLTVLSPKNLSTFKAQQ